MRKENPFLWIYFWILLSCLVYAQNYGKIAGIVLDSKTGQPLVGANVFIPGTLLGAATDADGYFVILQLKPGSYDLQCEYVGYQKQLLKGIVVNAGRVTTVQFRLEENVMEGEEIVVISSRPVVEVDNTSTLRSVSQDDISRLPITTVNEVINIQAGAVSSSDGLHLRGGRAGEVVYYIDGIPVANPLVTEIASNQIVNNDAISELQVISGTFSAEYGNAMSGIINITTQEGGQQWEVLADIRSSSPGLEDASTEENRNVVRTSLSGPIPLATNTTFFLSAKYDGRDSYLPWGYRIERNVFGKISSYLKNNLKLFISANASNGVRKSYSHPYKYIPEMYWIVPRTTNLILNVGLTHTLQKNLYYTMNAYYTRYSYRSGDYDYRLLTSEYRLDANNEFYTFNYVNSYSEDEEKTLGMKGDLVWQANSHIEVKSGFEYKLHDLYYFNIVDPYENNHILDNYHKKPVEFAGYIQEKINFSNIILSAGARLDAYNAYADYFENPYHAYYGLMNRLKSSEWHYQTSPRLGISFPVSSSTVFHFGYGHYFQRPDFIHLYKGLADENAEGLRNLNGDNRITMVDNYIMNLISGNGRFGNPDLKPQKTITYEFGVTHQLTNDIIISLSVYNKNITNLLGVRTFFAGDSSLDGIKYFETFTSYINEDFAANNGIEIQVKKRAGKHFVGEVNYTLAVAEGSSSRPLERVGVEEANRQTLKFFPLDFDQRHTLNIYAQFKVNKGELIPLLENLNASVLFKYGSGLPYTKGIRGSTAPYEINNMRLPSNWTIDLKLDRELKWNQLHITPYLEIYNLTNRKNVVYVDPFTGKPDEMIGYTKEYAANPLNWGPPRFIYLGFRIQY